MAKTYGKIEQEERLEQAIIAREIWKTIMDYGISQYQIQKIMYLLALELEDNNLLKDICDILKSSLDSHTETSDDKLITM